MRDAGGRALVVGGWVRDHLLGTGSKDVDIEVSGLDVERLESVLAGFGRVHAVGRAFGVFRVGGIDVDFSLPRRDSKRGPGHRGFDVTPDPSLGFAQAARRRDLTVNSIGIDPLTGEVLDPHGGRRDLERRVLRATDPERFPEDPLRGLRVAQLAARLEMAPDEELLALCRALDLGELSGERVFDELAKLLLRAAKALHRLPVPGGHRPAPLLPRARRPARGPAGPGVAPGRRRLGAYPHGARRGGLPARRSARRTAALDRFSRGSRPTGRLRTPCERNGSCRRRMQPVRTTGEHDAEGPAPSADDGTRSRDHGDGDLALMLGALCHDLGKPATTERVDGRIRSFRHDVAGVAPTRALLGRMRAPGALVDRVAALVEHHLAPALFVRNGATAKGYRRLARKLERAGVGIELLVRVARADHLGRTTADALAGRFDAGDAFLAAARAHSVEHAAPRDAVLGRHLVARGMKPGPGFAPILERCREIQDETGWTDPERILDRALTGR